MDFQTIVDSVQTMACIVSVEKKPNNSYGEIRLVTGNEAYIASIEHPAWNKAPRRPNNSKIIKQVNAGRK